MNSNQVVFIFLFITAVIYMIPILVQGFFDRYLIPIIPLLAASVTSLSAENHMQPPIAGEKIFPVVALMLVGLFFIFAVFGTQDYLAWNRARWIILEDFLESKPAKVNDIDGGFEFNGLHLYNPNYQKKPDKSWWWVDNDSFVVAFGDMPGYSVVSKVNYRKWMPPHNGSVRLLEKNTNDNAQPQDFKPAGRDKEESHDSPLPH